MDQKNAPLLEALLQHIAENPTPFHIPGHKLGVGVDDALRNFTGENIFKADLSEVQGLGNLHGLDDVISEAESLAAKAWGAKTTYFLVGGTSSGITASLCTTLREGDKVILPRNAHTSAYYGLVMSGADPIWLMPDVNKTSGIVTYLAPQKLAKTLHHYPDVKVVFVVSPTYLGVMSDMTTLATITHEHSALLIADEAHGSHLYFHEDFPKGALSLGADIVCQSTHKTGGSLTQSSLIHVGGNASDGIDFEHLRENLALVQSTSPSYLLMASLDAARRNLVLNGHKIFTTLLNQIRDTKQQIQNIRGITLLDNVLAKDFGSSSTHLDPLHLSISARKLGISGNDLYVLLRKKYNIEAEYAETNFVLFLLGIGTTTADLEKLVAALRDIAKTDPDRVASLAPDSPHAFEIASNTVSFPLPSTVLSPRAAWFAKKKTLPTAEAVNHICAEIIMAYPPGIPLVCPGEILTAEVVDALNSLKNSGTKFHSRYPDLSFVRVIA